MKLWTEDEIDLQSAEMWKELSTIKNEVLKELATNQAKAWIAEMRDASSIIQDEDFWRELIDSVDPKTADEEFLGKLEKLKTLLDL